MASASNSTLQQWALPRLQQLLPLDDESLRQVLQYADTLPKEQAAEHLKNLLGDDAKALEFIASFNMRRQNAPPAAAVTQQSQQSRNASAAQPPSTGSADRGRGGARGGRGGRKRPNIHSLPARQLEGQGDVAGAYLKGRGEQQDYMPRNSERQRHKTAVAENLALREAAGPTAAMSTVPDATQMPLVTNDAAPTNQSITSKAPPSAAGPLVSDSLGPKKKTQSTAPPSQGSRNQSPGPAAAAAQSKTKVHMSGGAQMRGASSALSDLDSAIRSLEIQTNPTLSSSGAASAGSEAENRHRRCNCMATRHPLLEIAPNCLSCGKIICIKQGLGPCGFCGSPLLSGEEIGKVLRVLREERGEERMRVNNAGHRRAEVSQGKARGFTGRDFLAAHSAGGASATTSSRPNSPLSVPSSGPATPVLSSSDDDGEGDGAAARAQAHRDKLLAFQSQNARRTHIHDEAADYDLPASGTNMWASPAERAQQLKRQQRALREMEWNSRPEYEKRRVVASIDLSGKGGKVVRRMAPVERPDFSADDSAASDDDGGDGGGVGVGGESGNNDTTAAGAGAGAFSRNPLAKGLVRPVARQQPGVDEEKGKGKEVEAREERKRSQWRRVQMDEDDNEQWILDGGAYGGQNVDASLGTEERGCG